MCWLQAGDGGNIGTDTLSTSTMIATDNVSEKATAEAIGLLGQQLQEQLGWPLLAGSPGFRAKWPTHYARTLQWIYFVNL